LVLSLGLFGLAVPANAKTVEPVPPKPTKPLLPVPPRSCQPKPKPTKPAAPQPQRKAKSTKPVQPVPPKPTKSQPGEPVQATLNVDYPAGTGTVSVTGAFSGQGTVETLKSKRAGCTSHFVVKLTFGSDSVNIKAVAIRRTRQLDASTCTVTETHKGAWIITTGSGAFANVKGHGHLTATATVTGTPDASKPKGCDLSSPTGTVVVNAKGRVKG
jgi:hypothetical protein